MGKIPDSDKAHVINVKWADNKKYPKQHFSTFQGPEGERLRKPESPQDKAAQRRAEEPPQGQRRACPLLHGQVEWEHENIFIAN